MRARVYEFAEFGFGRKEVEGLEKQFESTGGGEEAIREAANELIKALSEPERGKEEKQEHERMLQQEESGGSETKVVSPSSEVSASEIPQMGAIGQSEPTGSQGSPAAEPTISPSAPIESSETAEALNVESESDAKQFIPDRTELAASSKSREGSAVASQSHAALQGSDASSPLPSVSTPPVEHASTEATAAVTIKPAALAPPASTETMGESTALTDALESETEVETTEGELSVGRTPERPAEPATSADISAEVAKAPDLEGTAGTRTPDNSSLTTSTTPTGGHETEAAGTVPSPSSARAAETTETAPAQLEVAVEKSDAVSTHEVDKPDNKK